MGKTSYRVLTLTVGCMLLLSVTAEQALAWPCTSTSCPDCYRCTETGCERCITCSGCCVCSGCSCVGGSCPACKSCVGCSCECTSECCEDSDCGPCYSCVNCSCEGSPCGDEPTQEQRERFENWFPNLEWGEWSITGDATDNYNCISWSVEDAENWTGFIGPPESGDKFIDKDYGDNDGIVESSDFDAFYDNKGYEQCTEAEAGIQLYKKPGAEAPTNPDGITHAARKTDYGMWESKCGSAEKIDHMQDALNDTSETASYGEHFRYYKPK